MGDHLDDRIRDLVHELVAVSPPPMPRLEMLERASGRRGPAWTATVPGRVTVALAALAFGAAGILLGRYVLPSEPAGDAAVLVVAGTASPESRFDVDPLGTEVRLLPISGNLQPILPAGSTIAEVAAVGRIEGSDLEVFTWRDLVEDLEGRCVQVVAPSTAETRCSASRTPPPVEGPYTFPYGSGSGSVVTVVTWRVPEGTAVASLEVDDLRLWQRPVEQVAAFTVGRPGITVGYLTAWGREGELLGRIGFGAHHVDVGAAPGTVQGALRDGRS
jgi:hypothetical protein